MQDQTVYIPTPISELPVVHGKFYTVFMNSGQALMYFDNVFNEYNFKTGFYDKPNSEITHWLKPILLTDLIEENTKEYTLEDIKKAWYCYPHSIGGSSEKAFENWIKTFIP